jgi:hypothetical protein
MENQAESLIPEVLRCLLTKDVQTGRWLGHCLDFDIVTSGKDEDSAWNNLKAVVRAHVESCFTHWQDGLKFKASSQEIALFEALKEKQELFRSDKIEFRLTPLKRSELHPLHPLWIQGVEWVEGVGRGADQTEAVPAVN